MAQIALQADGIATGIQVFAVMAAEAAGRVFMPNVIGMRIPVGLLFGVNALAVGVLQGNNCLIDSISAVLTSVPAESRRKSETSVARRAISVREMVEGAVEVLTFLNTGPFSSAVDPGTAANISTAATVMATRHGAEQYAL